MDSPVDANRMLALVQQVAREARPNVDAYVALDSSLERDLGLDSLARVEVVLRLEREFGVSLPEQALATAETPRDLLRFLLAGAGQAPHAADRSVASLVQSEGVRPPVHAQTLTEALEYHVEKQPDRLTVFLYEEKKETPITYQALYDGSLAYAARLAEEGLQPGQMVAIMLPTSKEYLFSFYGTLLAGGVPVPLYPPARLTTIEDHMTRHVGILKSAGATIMITVAEAKPLAYLLRAQVESLRSVLTPSDFESNSNSSFSPVKGRGGHIGFLQYTSGSTGNPKGVVLTHENLLANVQAMGKAVNAGPADVFVSWLPLYHDMGLIGGCFATMFLGFPVVLMSPLAFLSRPSSWLRAIHRHRGTISGGPNFSYELCIRRTEEKEIEGIDLSSWRFAFNGAEPVSPETMTAFGDRFSRHGFPQTAMNPCYGLAECSVGLAFTPMGEPWRVDTLDRDTFSASGEAVDAAPGDPSPLRVVGCGHPIAAHDVRVVDGAGLELPDRYEGALQFRGPSATTGYYHNPEATKALFAGGGWLNSGDRAYLADGMLYITGREKDIIIRGGRNISPYELEEAVGDLPGIRRGCVAVFGSMDRASGTERVVVLAETREQDPALHQELKKKISALAVSLIAGPADDIVLAPPATVPKTSSGKIRRVAAREYYERGPRAVKPRAVWLQFVHLGLAGVGPQLRRGWRTARGLLFAARAWAVIGMLFPLVFLSCWIIPGAPAWRVTGKCARLFFRLARIPFVARGLENLPAAPCVLAVNHTSYLDGVALLAALAGRPFAFVAKRELKANLVTRVIVAGLGAEFVERFDVQKSVEHVDELTAAVKRGVSLIVFPEGTFQRQAGLMPFRAGGFQAAAQAGAPVAPAAIRGARSVLREGTWFLRRSPVTVNLAPPVQPAGSDWNAVVKLRDEVRAEILKRCGEPDSGS